MKKTSNIYFLLFGLFFSMSIFVNYQLKLPRPSIDLQETEYNFNEKAEVFNWGLKRFFSSTFWVKTLIDADTKHYEKHDLNSWLFLRFKTIISLDPKFLEVYRFGGLYLSIVKDDIQGANIIFDKGLEIYPDDFTLNLYAGYHYYLEGKQYRKALKCFQKVIQKSGSKDIFKSIAITLMEKSRLSKDKIKKELLNLLEKTEDPLVKKNLLKKLRRFENKN